MIYISPGMESRLGSILPNQDVTSLAPRTCEMHRTLDRKLSGNITDHRDHSAPPPNTHSLTVAQIISNSQAIFLFQPLHCWDYRCLTIVFLFIKYSIWLKKDTYHTVKVICNTVLSFFPPDRVFLRSPGWP